jgi:hypothetical protein
MDNQKQNSSTSWLKSHHINRLVWTLIALGVILAGFMLFWISRQ